MLHDVVMGAQGWGGRKAVAGGGLLGALFVATAVLSAVSPGGSRAPPASDRTAAQTPSSSPPGTTSWGTAVGPPGAPVSVVALSGTSQGEVSVRWSPGPGAPATRFFVVASPGGANATAPADGYPAEVVGLVPGAEYTFTVVAANPAGQSPPSMPTGPVRAKEPAPVDLPPSAPLPPPATRFADCSAEQVQIVFQRTEVFTSNGTVGLFEVRNTSGTECSLESVPVLQMLDATGNDIYTLWYAAAWLKTRYQTVVNLPAGSPPITPHGRRSGHAF